MYSFDEFRLYDEDANFKRTFTSIHNNFCIGNYCTNMYDLTRSLTHISFSFSVDKQKNILENWYSLLRPCYHPVSTPWKT